MGKALGVGGIEQNIRAAYDAEVKEVLLLAENFKRYKSYHPTFFMR